MPIAAGEFARAYNRRKKRQNAFWGDNFHAVLVEGGDYLAHCLVYVELNMVRCGVVDHPQEWAWVGYHEIMGKRQRYRLLDLERLKMRLGFGDLADLRMNLETRISERVSRDRMQRNSIWTESLCIGSQSFVEKAKPLILSRQETEISHDTNGIWVLSESPILYRASS